MASDLDRDEALWLRRKDKLNARCSDIALGACCPHIAHPRGYDWKTFAIWVSDADYTYVFIKQAAACGIALGRTI